MSDSLTQVLTSAVSGNSTAVQWVGGIGQMVVTGTFDSATVSLQMSPDDGSTWITVSGSSLTSADCKNFDLNSCDLRLAITSAGASTSINAWTTNTTGQWT
ncbi:hypothetical protein CL634_02995 [bacterium]|nr:hypothetical protein [bacterium]